MKGTIKMNLRKIELEGLDWIHLAHVRDWWPAFENIVLNHLIP
jgi:hypothetical protein